MSKSAIARVMGLACNTVDRWLEKAAACCRRLNQVHTCDRDIRELQVDEVRAFAGRKDQATCDLHDHRCLVSVLAGVLGRATQLQEHALGSSRGARPDASG